MFFLVVQWPKSHSRPITQGPKKQFPIHTAGHCFVTCVCMRFSSLAEKLCSTNHKPLFSRPNRIHPIHILLTLILSTGPNSSIHQSRTVFEGPRMLYLFTHVRWRQFDMTTRVCEVCPTGRESRPITNHFLGPNCFSLFTLLTI
jgi:hypothetical protein